MRDLAGPTPERHPIRRHLLVHQVETLADIDPLDHRHARPIAEVSRQRVTAYPRPDPVTHPSQVVRDEAVEKVKVVGLVTEPTRHGHAPNPDPGRAWTSRRIDQLRRRGQQAGEVIVFQAEANTFVLTLIVVVLRGSDDGLEALREHGLRGSNPSSQRGCRCPGEIVRSVAHAELDRICEPTSARPSSATTKAASALSPSVLRS